MQSNSVKNKVTFQNKGTNAAQINAGTEIAIQAQNSAEAHNNLPHNSLIITNQNETCTIFLYLDDFSDEDNPDYVVFPSQSMALNLDDGVSFTTLFLKNTHASSNIAIGEIKYNIQTIKEVN